MWRLEDVEGREYLGNTTQGQGLFQSNKNKSLSKRQSDCTFLIHGFILFYPTDRPMFCLTRYVNLITHHVRYSVHSMSLSFLNQEIFSSCLSTSLKAQIYLSNKKRFLYNIYNHKVFERSNSSKEI